MHNPSNMLWKAVERILHYLEATPCKSIMFKRNNGQSLKAYTDIDYTGSLTDRRSTFGYGTF